MGKCSVLSGYLASLRKGIDYTLVWNEFGLSMQEQLEEQAREVLVSRATEHMRAFACVERSYERLLQLCAALPQESTPDYVAGSSVNLTALLNWAQSMQDYVQGMGLEFVLGRGTDASMELSMDQLLHHGGVKVVHLCSFFLSEVRTLRRSLLNSNTSLRQVGYNYGMFMLTINGAISDAHQRAADLATIMEEKHVRGTASAGGGAP
jgi:hypothetical protein